MLILDEPTSALSPPETRRLFELVRRLGARGVAVVFISHFIEDVLEICDRVTILRDGRCLGTEPRQRLDKHEVIQRMLGRSARQVEAGYEGAAALPPRSTIPPVLRVCGLKIGSREATVVACEGSRHTPHAVADGTRSVPATTGVSLEVSAGECLGLYGFVGAGHRELVHALAGAIRAASGQVLLDDRPLPPGNVRDAVQRGVVLVSGDRAQGLFLRGEVYKNVTLAHLRSAVGRWVAAGREIARVRPILERVGCRPAEPCMLAGQLSGGNQQKAILARWLLGPVRILLLDEPTRGMDVGAKADVMRLVAEMKQQGAAVVLASAEPELLLAHADRILVMSRGRITREFVDTQVDKAELMRWA